MREMMALYEEDGEGIMMIQEKRIIGGNIFGLLQDFSRNRETSRTFITLSVPTRLSKKCGCEAFTIRKFQRLLPIFTFRMRELHQILEIRIL